MYSTVPIQIMALTLSLPYATPVFAKVEPAPSSQTDDATNNLVDGEIVVTAQGRIQRLKDVPVSASVISGVFLTELGIQTIGDLATRLPNVRIAQAPASDLLNIRGVGSGLNSGFEQSVGTFVDGIYRGRSRASRAALFDIERVEVLKGPQTTFFGNNAIAGAFNITTRKPSSSLQMDLSSLVDFETNRYIVEGGISGPLSSTLRARAAVQFNGDDGYIENSRISQDGPRLRDIVGRISLDWTPTSTVKLEGRFDRGHFRDTGVYNAETLNCPANIAFGAPRGPCARAIAGLGQSLDSSLNYKSEAGPSFFDYDLTEAQIKGSVDLGPVSVIATTGYFDHKYDYLIDVAPLASASVVGTTAGFPNLFIEGYQQFSQELRIQSTTTRFLEYMVGAYFMHNQLELDSVAGFYFAPFGARIPQLNASSRVAAKINNKQTENSFSIFGAVTFNIAERFRVNIGSRYSNVDKSGNRAVQLGTAGASPSLSSFTAGTDLQQAVIASILSIPTGNYAETRRNDQKFMPSASVQFDITDDTMVYASYANGFKAGGYGFYLSGATFDPETVNAYEAGVKTDLFDRRLSINVAAFYSKFSDLQESINVNVPGAGTINVVENAAKSTVKGLEFTTVIRPSDALTISADLGYLSSKYNDYVGAPCASLQNLRPGCTQDLSGITRAFAPKWSGNIGLSYIVPLKNDNLAIAVSPLLYFSSKYFQQATADPLLEQDGFYKLDLTVSVGRRDDRWNVSIVGSNLTDRRTGSFRAVLPGSPGSSQVLPDPQRRIALRLAVKL